MSSDDNKGKSSDVEPFVSRIPVLDLSEGPQLLVDFIAEANDHLNTAEGSIIQLESDPGNKEAIGSIFRAFHTIKGLASFFNLEDIRTLAHDAETMLDKVRSDIFKFEKVVADLAFASIDGLRKFLNLLSEQVENQGQLKSPYYDAAELVVSIRRVNRMETLGPIEQPKVGEILVKQGDVTPEELDAALSVQKQDPNKKLGEILIQQNAASQKNIDNALTMQKNGKIETAIKINVEKLDTLIDLVGELVISETQVIHNTIIKGSVDQKLNKDVAQLQLLTRTLQEHSMTMRLIPIQATFQKMVRLVRDLSKKANKKVDIKIYGEETEIDKNMVELISDPLIHMIRNSVDHGIEMPQKRIENGKPETGNIELRAFQRAGNVVIQIKDDGAGLVKSRILRKAIERGLVKEEDNLPEQKIFNLIFEPGFSTAEKVTDISGRGVGMDVVKRNIEQLRGRIDITSEEGKGTTFSISLPVTLAIIDGVVLSVGEEKYILPVMSVAEFIQPQRKFITNVVGKGEVIKVHDKVYPVVYLQKCFNVEAQRSDIEMMTGCLVESENGSLCIMVDELVGQQQVVIKNLGEKFHQIKGVAGATILGDGKVGLILDVNGILELAA